MTMAATLGGHRPRPSATVVILRDTHPGIEVLLTVRPRHFRFMGGATVFPGGAVAEADLDPRWAAASALGPSEAAAALGGDDPASALGAFVCAVREAFEEVGWLAPPAAAASLGRTEADDPERFLHRCLELGLTLATDRLVPAGRWVTPLGSPIRFDTRFFLADAGPRWEPAPHPEEVAGCRWATPAAALGELAAGGSSMAPPTIEMLHRLGDYDSFAAAAAALEDGAPWPAGAHSPAQAGLAGTPPGRGARVTQLSPLVAVVLAPNPGVMTGPGTNTYVVGKDTGPHVVIDPATDDTAYLDAVQGAAGEITSIIVTHRHPDHVGGVGPLVRRTGAPVRAWGADAAGDCPVEPLSDGAYVMAGALQLTAVHAPGHAPDHLCLLLDDDIPGTGKPSLLAGDNVLGEGTAVVWPPDGDMRTYFESLKRLAALDVGRIYPGHFHPLEGGRHIIEGYIAHRRQRHEAILNAVGAAPSTVPEIVESVYGDTRAELKQIAAHTVLAHLLMAEAKGRVLESGGSWASRPPA